jgi:hypothetical protein
MRRKALKTSNAFFHAEFYVASRPGLCKDLSSCTPQTSNQNPDFSPLASHIADAQRLQSPRFTQRFTLLQQLTQNSFASRITFEQRIPVQGIVKQGTCHELIEIA